MSISVLQTAEYLDVIGGTIIGNNLVRFRAVVRFLSLEMTSLYDEDFGISKLLDFTSPLIFERGGAEDEYRANKTFLA